MDLQTIINKMQEHVDEFTRAIDQKYENIKEQADNGNKHAQTVINYGSEDEVKDMIAVALKK